MFEGELESAEAFRLELGDDDLVLAAPVVDADVAAGDDLLAVGELEVQLAGDAAKHDSGELGVGVFQGEVTVTGGRGGEVGDFAFDPDGRELAFEESLDAAGQFGDGENLRGHGWRGSGTRWRQ